MIKITLIAVADKAMNATHNCFIGILNLTRDNEHRRSFLIKINPSWIKRCLGAKENITRHK